VLEETSYRCLNLTHVATFRHDDGNHEPYDLHLYYTPYDETQNVVCLEGQELKFVKREELGAKPFLDFLIPYWDRSIALMKG
jgi:hypothetical protein